MDIPRFQFKVYDCPLLPANLKESWNELLAESKSNSLFLTWEWVSTWCCVYVNRYQLLITFVFDQQGALVAIAPFKINLKKRWFNKPISVLEFIGWGELVTPEYLDIIVKAGLEDEVLPQLFDYLVAQNSIDAIELKPFNPDSGNLRVIESYLGSKDGTLERVKYSECPIFDLPRDWSTYLGGKSKNFRKKMKEYDRICHRDLDFKIQQCKRKDNINFYFKNFVNLHQNRWNGKSKAFLSQRYLEFHKTIMEYLLEKNQLRLLIAFDGTTPIAGIYCYYYNSKYQYYQSGRNIEYDKYRVGLVLINTSIQHAIREGASSFDFLTGNEPYKFRWAEKIQVNYSLNYFIHKQDFLIDQVLKIMRYVGKNIVNTIRNVFVIKRK